MNRIIAQVIKPRTFTYSLDSSVSTYHVISSDEVAFRRSQNSVTAF